MDFEELEDDPDAGEETPVDGLFLRATVTPRGVWLNPPVPGLILGGPPSMTLARLAGRAVIVDLRFDGCEIIATVPPNAPPVNGRAVRVLAEWASTVGFRRLWLPGRILELEDRSGGVAQVECPSCTSVWVDSTPRFWAEVRHSGCFPGYCPACGASLPEWRVRRGRSAPQRAATSPQGGVAFA